MCRESFDIRFLEYPKWDEHEMKFNEALEYETII